MSFKQESIHDHDKLPHILAWLVVAYLLLILIYQTYGAITQTGLYGYLLSMQITLLGDASQRLTFIVGLLLLWCPALAIAYVGKTFVPHLFTRPVYTAKVDDNLRRRNLAFITSWTGCWVVTAVPMLLTLIVGGIYYYRVKREFQQPVFRTNLSEQVGSVPKQGTFVDVLGAVNGTYAVGYREGTSYDYTVHVYVPVVGQSWTRTEPVLYIAHYETQTSQRDAQPDLPQAFRRGEGHFTGQLQSSLPTVVRREYDKKGIALAPEYRVIKWIDMPAGRPPASAEYGAVLEIYVVGFGVSALAFSTMLLMKRILTSSVRNQG